MAGLVSVLSFLAVSCDPGASMVLERENLFSLEIGRLEDQMDLLTRKGVVSQGRNRIIMRDGIIYISNEAAAKVMVFNSFGDLIALYYHPDENPIPVSLQLRDDQGGLTTRIAVPYRFRRIGEIAVDSRKHLAIVDMLPPERSVYDPEIGVRLDWTILRFDDNGELLDYLGQEGVGGTPFPYIEQMRTNIQDELMVVCDTVRSKIVYLYSPGGELLYQSEILYSRLPVPSSDTGYIAVLDHVTAGYEHRRAYIKVSYYLPSVDEQTGKEFGIGFVQSRVYWLDLDTGRYESYVELPDDFLYEMVGIARGGHIFLAARHDDGTTELVIMNTDGRVVRRRLLDITEYDLFQRSFSLEPNGILTAMLAYSPHVDISWWRTDRLLPRGAVRDR